MSINKLFEPGTRIAINNQFGYLHPTPGGMEVEITFDGQEAILVPRQEIIDQFVQRNLTIIEERQVQEEADLSLTAGLSNDKLNKLVIRSMYVSDFLESGYSTTRENMQRSLEHTSSRLNLGPDFQPPSVSTLHNGIKTTRASGVHANPMNALAQRPRRRNKRIADDIEMMIDDTIKCIWMTNRRKTKAHAYRCFVAACQEHLGIDVGGKYMQTFYNRIADQDEYSVTKARKGDAEARKVKHSSKSRIVADSILDVVEIDAVHLGIGLLDEKGSYIGYPVVHVVIDVFSRAVIGFAIELNSETSDGVVQSLKSALSPKNKIIDFPFTLNDWPMYGRMLLIIHDGGTAQTGQPVGNYLGIAGISHTVCQTRTPYYKPVVERFNRTLRDRFADHMDGYVGRMENPKGNIHIIKKAASMTLDNFRQELLKFVIDDYNQSAHSGFLGRSPYSKWKEACISTPVIPVANLELADKIYGKIESRTYSDTNGIRLHNIYYNDNDGKLHDIFLKLSAKERRLKMFECIYTASDISTITVKVQGQIVIAYVRKTEGYISVYKGMTLAEYQAERGRLKAEAVNLNRLTGGVKMDYGVESDRGQLNNYRSSKAQQTSNNVKTKTKRPNPVTDTANTSKEVADIVRDDPNHKLH